MKVQGQKSRKYKEKEYYKHWVIIPNELFDELGWKDGDDLIARKKGNILEVWKK